MNRHNCSFPILAVIILSSLSFRLFAQPVDFSGNLDLIIDDAGGAVYSGVAQGTLFTGNIDPQTGAGEISDGSTPVVFSCCIAAGALSVSNNEILDAETAGLLNQLVGSTAFSVGQLVDGIDIEGDVATAGGGRIEVGLSYLFPATEFDDESPDNYPFDPAAALVALFFILEEDDTGEDIYSAVGQLRDQVTDQIPLQERQALLALFTATGGPQWADRSGWDPDPSSIGTECSWFGLSCLNGSVTALDLELNNLMGTIPAELADLTNLEQLALGSNNLTGGIPSELGSLDKLRVLDLSNNNLAGQIPQQLLGDPGLDFDFSNNPGLIIGQPAPNPPPAKVTLQSDGTPTTAMVSGGITSNGGESYSSNLEVGDTIEIFVRLEPEAVDIGHLSAIYVVASAGLDFLLVTPGGLVPWDGQLGSLIPFDEIVLAAANEFNILEPFGGQFMLTASEVGSYNFYIGYTTAADTVTYNDESIQLDVTD